MYSLDKSYSKARIKKDRKEKAKISGGRISFQPRLDRGKRRPLLAA